MQEKLDGFGGRDVQVGELRVLGSSDELVGQLDPDEELFVVGKAVVTEITHGEKGGRDDRAYTRTHRAHLVRFFALPPDQGKKLLEQAKVAADERFGVQGLGLFEEDDEPNADE